MVLSLIIHWLHLSAVVIWIGGLGFNLIILSPNLNQIDLINRRKLVSKILPSFLKLVWISISIIVATGLYRIVFVNKMTTLADFTNSNYGLLLLVKILIVISMIILAAIITIRLKPGIIAHLSAHIEDEPIQKSCSTCVSMLKHTRSLMMTVFIISFVVIFIAAFLRGA